MRHAFRAQYSWISGPLSGESCAIVIDDAHHALRDAGVLIDWIAARLASPQRLLVAARQLPPGCERLRRADAVQFSAVELALRPGETLEFCRSGFGLGVSSEDGSLLDGATRVESFAVAVAIAVVITVCVAELIAAAQAYQ